MAKLTITFGLALVVVGIIGFWLTGHTHPTALIPVVIGLLMLALGWTAQEPARRRHAMHGAAALALLGFLGCVRGLLSLPRLLAGQAVPRPPAVVEQAVTALLCLAFVALAARSFSAARRAE